MKKQTLQRELLDIPAGILLDAVEALKSEPRNGIPTVFKISKPFIEALVDELRFRGYKGEVLASELQSLLDYAEMAKAEDAHHEDKNGE